MRALLIVVLVVIGLGFVFWDNLFYSAEEEDAAPVEETPVTVVEMDDLEPPATPEPDPRSEGYERLMAQGKWGEARSELEGIPPGQTGVRELSAKHLCLLNMELFDEASKALEILVQQFPASPTAARAVLDMAEKSPRSAKWPAAIPKGLWPTAKR